MTFTGFSGKRGVIRSKRVSSRCSIESRGLSQVLLLMKVEISLRSMDENLFSKRRKERTPKSLRHFTPSQNTFILRKLLSLSHSLNGFQCVVLHRTLSWICWVVRTVNTTPGGRTKREFPPGRTGRGESESSRNTRHSPSVNKNE